MEKYRLLVTCGLGIRRAVFADAMLAAIAYVENFTGL